MTTDHMSKPGVRIVGEKAPRLSSNADRLEGGSVIYGRLNVFADGFKASDAGFDMGKFTCDACTRQRTRTRPATRRAALGMLSRSRSQTRAPRWHPAGTCA